MTNSEHVQVRQQLTTLRKCVRLYSFRQFGVQDLLNTKEDCKASSSPTFASDPFSALWTQRRTIRQPDSHADNDATFRAQLQTTISSPDPSYHKTGATQTKLWQVECVRRSDARRGSRNGAMGSFASLVGMGSGEQ